MAPPPPGRELDANLVVGAAMFGIGWAISGVCPGPGVLSLAVGARALPFVLAMGVGMVLARGLAGTEQP